MLITAHHFVQRKCDQIDSNWMEKIQKTIWHLYGNGLAMDEYLSTFQIDIVFHTVQWGSCYVLLFDQIEVLEICQPCLIRSAWQRPEYIWNEMITQAGIIHGHALQTEYSLPTNHIAFEQSVQILLHLDTYMYWFVINYSGILRPSQHLLHHTIGHSLPESSSCDATCSNTSLPKQGAKRVPCRLRTCILPYVTKNRLCHAALRTLMIRSCWEQPWRTTLPVTRHQ